MRRLTRLAVAAALAAFCLGAARAATATQADQFQQAIDLMETKGDYPAAVRLFEQVARGPDRALAARSLLYLGHCYEKLGQEESVNAYRRVLREFPEQREAVEAARAQLSALGQPVGAGEQTAAVRRVWSGPEVDIMGAPSPDGSYLSFVDWDTGDLAMYELATGEKRRLTDKGSWIDSPDYAEYSMPSPDGKRIAYGWSNGDRFYDLRVIELGTSRSEPRILYRREDTDYVQPAAWSPDGTSILAIIERAGGSNQIAWISAVNGSARVLKTLDGRWPHARMSPDGRSIAYDFPPREDSPNRDIFLLAADGSREIPLVEHLGDDRVLGWAPDGNHVLFSSDRTGDVSAWVIAVAGGTPGGDPWLVRRRIGPLFPMNFTRRGSYYYGLPLQMTDVYQATIEPSRRTLETSASPAIRRAEGSNSSPAWSPDGLRLAYLSGISSGGAKTRTLVVRTLPTGQERELTVKVRLNQFSSLRWSPDGRSFLIQAVDEKGREGFYRVMAETGGAAAILLEEPGEQLRSVDWSAEGNALYFIRHDSTNRSRLMRRDLRTGVETELYRSRLTEVAALSPNGHWLAFAEGVPAAQGAVAILKVLPIAGGEPRELLRASHPIRAPAWMPDGASLLVVTGTASRRDPKDELWQVPVEGGTARSLGILPGGIVRHVSVHPDGRRIAFSADRTLNEVWVMENVLAAKRK